MALKRRHTRAVVFLLICAGTRAQTTSAVCSGDFSWAVNNLNQSPCLVASYLLLPCTPGGGNVGALLQPGLSYITPTLSGGILLANPCTCSTVTYSAIQACALCQAGKSVSWSAWHANCTEDEISLSTYPEEVDPGTRIPRWMFDDVVAADDFDLTTAEKVAASGLPDAKAGFSPTSDTVAAAPTGLGGKIGATPGSAPTRNVPLVPIILASIGGIAVLLIIAIITTCLVRRAKKRRGHTRGKSLEGLVIGKPMVPPSPAAPNTASSFGMNTAAPPSAGNVGKTGKSGWPNSPRERLPIPNMSSVESVALPTSAGTRDERQERGMRAVGSSSTPETIATRRPTPGPQAVAGPGPRDPRDPADPRTWPPSGPPPPKILGPSNTPRQMRALRVGSRDDDVRYPTPQPAQGSQPLQTQQSIEQLRMSPTRPLVVPARYPSPVATVTTRPTPTHSPSTSQSGQSVFLGRAAHSPSASASGPAAFANHTPSSSQSSVAGHRRFDSSEPLLAGRSAHSPNTSVSSPGGPPRFALSPGGSQSEDAQLTISALQTSGSPSPSPSSASRYAPSPASSPSQSDTLSPTLSSTPLRYQSPSQVLAAEREGRSPPPSVFPVTEPGAQRLTVAAPRVGPNRTSRRKKD